MGKTLDLGRLAEVLTLDVNGNITTGTTANVLYYNTSTNKVTYGAIGSGLPTITPSVDEGKVLTVVSDVATWQDPTEIEMITYGTF